MTNFSSFTDEFLKLAVITREQAETSLEKLKELESKDRAPELARRAGVGAAVVPVAGMATRMVGGAQKFLKPEAAGKVSIRSPLGLAKAVDWGKIGRQAAADAAWGAIGGGGMPVIQSKVERTAERERLKDFLAAQEGKRRHKSLRQQIQAATGV